MDRIRKALAAASLIAALSAPALGSAQEDPSGFAGGGAPLGRIVGRIVDARTDLPIASANAYIQNDARMRGISGIDGRFVIRDVPEGSHTVVVEMLGYGSKSVTDLVVASGLATVVVQLEPQAIALEGISVEVAVDRSSATALVQERMTGAAVMDAIGADQISRSPDGDAAAALKRVPGLSVVDGKFAYVRGLGERYSSTTLNGAPLASPMPDRKVVPLDIIPSGLLESIVTSKSYSPDQPGDYAGGLVELRTKNFPSRRIASFSASTGYNSVSTLRDGLRYAGGGLDFLGFDNGARALPSILPTDQRVIFPNFSRGELERFGEAFGGDWGPVVQKLPMNGSIGASFGDDLEVFGRSLGLLTSVTYSSDFSTKADIVERIFTSGNADNPEVDYAGEATTRSVSLGGLANFSYELTSTDRVTGSFVYNRLMDDEARTLEGFNLDTNANQRNHRIRFLAQTLANARLEGEHLLSGLSQAKVDWRGAWSRASRYEPNTREVLYREDDGRFSFYNFVSSGSVFHQNLIDDTYSGATDVTLPFTLSESGLGLTLRFGGSGSIKRRDAFARRFRFLAPGGRVDEQVLNRDPNDLFDPGTIGPDGFELAEATFRPDNYDASENIFAGYAMLDTEISESIRLMTGARVEKTTQDVQPLDLFDMGLPPLDGAKLDDLDLLPAANLVLRLGDDLNVRAGWSRTLARPQLRELAPFAFADYAGGYLTVGNPELVRSRIQNFDLRWEVSPGYGSIIAASGFYKTFSNPIEVSVLPSTELLKTWVNGGEARNFGMELEFRSTLAPISPLLGNFAVNTNLTLVRSTVNTPREIRVYIPGQGGLDLDVVAKERALQGQSPYVVNATITYADGGGDLRASALFNRVGRRIDAVGGQATPDVYEESRSQLDLVLEKRATQLISLKLSAGRLLGNVVRFTQEGDLLREWNTGRSLSFSASWSTND